jgi:hypothetical protein
MKVYDVWETTKSGEKLLETFIDYNNAFIFEREIKSKSAKSRILHIESANKPMYLIYEINRVGDRNLIGEFVDYEQAKKFYDEMCDSQYVYNMYRIITMITRD